MSGSHLRPKDRPHMECATRGSPHMSQTTKLANILMSNAPQFVQVPPLLCRSDRPFVEDDGAWRLDGAGTFDFTTFFNALSVGKWLQYSVAKTFWLHLELRGAACEVSLTRADAFSYDAEIIQDTTQELSASEEWRPVDVELPSSPRDVLEAFQIVTQGSVYLRDGYYYTKVDESELRSVELALCTTTFKKEAYIERNIELVRKEILGSDESISRHFQMHVIDNGRTLDAPVLEGEGIFVHPNDNAGGAGGFARGMMEAMEQTPRATHVLLMDDDVVLSPESVLRTYNLLRLVNDAYQDAFVSGAMMSLNDPGLRWEDMGHVSFDGKFQMLKRPARMDYMIDVVSNETYLNPCRTPHFEDREACYAAWWYCAIPMTQIDRNGLPLPLFVRGDDVEYSRRCNPRFMTMNGICIWHMAFDRRYNAAQERYQMTRNCLIDQFTTDIAPRTDFMAEFLRAFQLDLKKFNYTDAALTLRGIEDFLKGPEWIMQPVAQEAFMSANREAEKLLPLDQIKKQAAELGVDLERVTRWDVERDFERDERTKISDFVTIGGNRFTAFQVEKGKTVVISAVGWAYPSGKLHGAEHIIAIDMVAKRGIIRSIDKAKFRELWDRYRRDMREYNSRKDELRAAYREARKDMTTVAFWKHYLGLDAEQQGAR